MTPRLASPVELSTASSIERQRARHAVDHRHAIEQRAGGDGAQHEVLHGRFGGDAGVAIERDHGVDGEREQLDADVHREQAVRGRQHEHAEQRGEREHEVLAAQQPAPVQVRARIQQRERRRTGSRTASAPTRARPRRRGRRTAACGRARARYSAVSAAPTASVNSVKVAVSPRRFWPANTSTISTTQIIDREIDLRQGRREARTGECGVGHGRRLTAAPWWRRPGPPGDGSRPA